MEQGKETSNELLGISIGTVSAPVVSIKLHGRHRRVRMAQVGLMYQKE